MPTQTELDRLHLEAVNQLFRNDPRYFALVHMLAGAFAAGQFTAIELLAAIEPARRIVAEQKRRKYAMSLKPIPLAPEDYRKFQRIRREKLPYED